MNDALTFLRERASEYHGRAAIVGKGPSFAEFDADAHCASRFVIGLNESALRTRCHAAFIIDEDIIESHGAELAARNLEALITPRVPHQRASSVGNLVIYGPGKRPASLAPWSGQFEDRHFQFNLSTVEPDSRLGPVLQAFNFSAPTLANLLAEAGFRDVLLAGIDGGTSYADHFKQFEFKKLRSVQNEFDAQFAELRQVRDRLGVEFRSVRSNEHWILIGAEAEQILAAEVLKWSIESRTFLSVKYCDAAEVSRSMYVDGMAGTPFSFQRLFLPQMAGRTGRGVYFDSDMLVFRDVYELFNHDMSSNVLLGCQPTPGRKPQYSVFLVDNHRANWDPETLLHRYNRGELSYEALMRDFAFAEPKASSLPMEWNSLELFDSGRTANIHYTDMGTQPWLSVYNPNADLWCDALFKALKVRPEVRRALELSLDRGWVRPSLKWQIEHDRAEPWSLPREVKRMDSDWLPPHIRMRNSATPRASQIIKWKLASRVRRLMQSRNYVRLMRAGQAFRKIF